MQANAQKIDIANPGTIASEWYIINQGPFYKVARQLAFHNISLFLCFALRNKQRDFKQKTPKKSENS